jgi:hypothetical protein
MSKAVKFLRARSTAFGLLTEDTGSDPWTHVDPGAVEKINALPQVKRRLSSSDVIVRRMRLFNSVPMHNSLCFTVAALDEVMPMIAGKPVMVNHNTYDAGLDGLPVGRFFDVDKGGDGTGHPELWPRFFMLAEDPECRALDLRIGGGLVSEVSPTVFFRDLTCSICGAEDLECEHRMGAECDGKPCLGLIGGIDEFLEGSICWAGMQKGTEILAAGRMPAGVLDTERLLGERAERIAAPPLSAMRRWWESK